MNNEKKLKKLKAIDIPIQSYLGPLGMTGHTAYIGLLKHGELKAGQTVFHLHIHLLAGKNFSELFPG